MKTFWLILSLLPAAFFFHLYEFGQHVKREDAPFLLIGCVLYVAATGILSSYIKIAYMIWVNIIAGFFSVLLAMYFIPDDGWFKPVGRDVAIIITAIIFFLGQLLVRSVSKSILLKEEVLR